MSKVFVLGIDGADPRFIFNEWINELPNIKKLIENGCYCALNSTIPPLSVVAWTSMLTGKRPSNTGIFEYIFRKDYSYDTHPVSSQNLKEKTIWQIVSEHNKIPIVCFMPLCWPIKPFKKGICVGGFTLTPGTNVDYTYPKEIKQEINNLFKEFIIIENNFRDVPKQRIIEEAYNVTEMHFKLMKHFLKNKEWDLFFGIIAQSDSMNHIFLRYVDKLHRDYEPESEFENVMKDYYKFIDKNLGELMQTLDEDTKIIIVSDHGIKRMHNRINLSDWLIQEGYLVLKEPIREKTKLKKDMINWGKTRVWAIGAFEGQIFLNLKGREPQGIVELHEYNELIEELIKKLGKITGDKGKILNTKFFTKKDFKGKYQNIAPDIMVYFDDLFYGSNTSLIGNKTLWSPSTAIGSDNTTHSKKGIFIMKNNKDKSNLIDELDITDVTPIILNELGIPIPKNIDGKIINEK